MNKKALFSDLVDNLSAWVLIILAAIIIFIPIFTIQQSQTADYVVNAQLLRGEEGLSYFVRSRVEFGGGTVGERAAFLDRLDSSHKEVITYAAKRLFNEIFEKWHLYAFETDGERSATMFLTVRYDGSSNPTAESGSLYVPTYDSPIKFKLMMGYMAPSDSDFGIYGKNWVGKE